MNGLYQTLGALVAAGAVAGLCLYRIRRLKQERAQLEAFARSLLRSQESERKRMAAEIHDGLGQNLLIINSRAALGLGSTTDPAVMENQLQEISRVCLLAIEEARQIAHNLGPPHLESTGLTEALEVMIDRVAASTRIQFHQKLEPVDELFSSESATTFYRIVQEALNNVMKHANALSVRVELVRDIDYLQLTVHDNGRGFDADEKEGSRRTGGFGLAAIAERVRMFGGALDITSGSGQGTRLTITIPIKDGVRL